ncbi:MAG: hypothetical protein QG626_829 [Patescibacteria group bacterium]|nr:hypothetical protein [Patescibacteria group bacterium]
MEQDQDQIRAYDDGIDVGRVILAWETWEFIPVQRSSRWYILASAAGLGMLIYALLTNNFVFALIIVMFAVIILMRDLKKPSRVQAAITSEGVVFNNEFYPFNDIKDFSVIFEPPVSNLYLGFNNRFAPLVSIPLDDADPNQVRAELLPFIFENLERDSESLTDTLSRVYKL